MHILAIKSGPKGELQRIQLTENAYTLGRSRLCDIPIPHQYLSRQHSKLEKRQEDWWLMDLGSKNGTFVNDQRIERPTQLTVGDRVKVADVEGVLEREEPSHSVTSMSDFSSLGNSVILDARRFLDQLQSGSSSTDATPNERRLHLLNEVHSTVVGIRDLRGLGRLMTDKLVALFDPDEAVVATMEDGVLVPLASYPGGRSTLSLSESLVQQVCEERQAVLHQEVLGGDAVSGGFDAGQSLILAGVWSLVATPILDGERVLGMIALARSRQGFQAFLEEDLELLTSLSSVAALRIQNLDYLNAAEEQRKLEQEISIARGVQRSLLPDILPEIPGYDLVAQNMPSRGVSGDIYQVYDQQQTVSLLLVDVSGKGVPAAMLTATVEALVAGLMEIEQSPVEIADRLGRQLYARTPIERYATGVLTRVDVASGALEIVSAGHNTSLLIRAGGEIEQLDSTGVPWGLMPEANYSSRRAEMAHGDILIFYSDGITEAENKAGEEYGLDRLIAVCKESRLGSLGELVAAVGRDLDEFSEGVHYHDDRTLLAFRRVSLDQLETVSD